MVLGLGAGLTKQGHRVFVYGYDAPPPGDFGREVVQAKEAVLQRAAAAGIEARVFPSRRSEAAAVFRRHDELTSWLSSNRDALDVMVIHGAFGFRSGTVAGAARAAGIPCVACPHTPYSPELFGRRKFRKRAYWRFIEAPFLRQVQAIHVLAPSHVRYLRDLGISVPAFVVPNGLDRTWLDRLEQDVDPNPTPSSREGVFRVLFLGRLDVYVKGLDLLLEALSRDRAFASRASVQVVGAGSDAERSSLEALISSRGLEGQVSLAGFQSDVRSSIRSADVVILPARVDGFSLAAIEALALGTPVIVTSKVGLSEFFGREEGVLVADLDAESLALALRVASESRAVLRAAAWSARPRLSSEFNWDHLAARWIEEIGRLGIADPHRPEEAGP